MTKPQSQEPYGKLGKKFVKKYKIKPELAEELEQEAANLYAHGTREGWCCACEADIAFALSWIKDTPEYQSLIQKEADKKMLEMKTENQLLRDYIVQYCTEQGQFRKALRTQEDFQKRFATIKSNIEKGKR